MPKFEMNVNEILASSTVDHVEILHDLARRAGGSGPVVVASYGEDPETGKSIAPKVRHFTVGDAAGTKKFIESIQTDHHRNVYMPLTLLKPGTKPTAKGMKQDIETVLGLCADFDDDRAIDWEDRLPLAPDMVLETSLGRFQCIFLFDGGLSPAQAEPLAQALREYTDCDHGTADISHVWRVPGCLNWPNKKKVAEGRQPDPQLVKSVVDWDGDSFTDPHEFAKALGSVSPAKPKPDLKVVPDDGLILEPGRRPPNLKFAEMPTCHSNFLRTFANNRPDIEEREDHSPSVYDLALCNMAVLSGWSDQEIVDLMIAFREENNHDLKLHNRQYYQRTIARARNEAPKEAAKEKAASEEQRKAEAWDTINRIIDKNGDLVVQRIVRYEKESPAYKFRTNKGAFTLPADTLNSQTKARNEIFKALEYSTPRQKPAQWGLMLNQIRHVREIDDLGPEAKAAGQIRFYLENYLQRFRRTTMTVSELKRDDLPARIVRDTAGNIKIYAEFFKRFCRTKYGWQETGIGNMFSLLAEIGLKRSTVSAYGTSFSAWKLPDDLAKLVN